MTKVDDSLLPRAEALKDFTATESSHLSFKVYTYSSTMYIIMSLMHYPKSQIQCRCAFTNTIADQLIS